mmetsp:Transcript_15760/g.36231  ORF Transcript_15760/g.36231 Transcript_15760/m.36231 type:complete len:188 (-) Transcript_15760:46-609(-)
MLHVIWGELEVDDSSDDPSSCSDLETMRLSSSVRLKVRNVVRQPESSSSGSSPARRRHHGGQEEADADEGIKPLQKDGHEPRTAAEANGPSVGSVFHVRGQCRPCAWHWRSEGCRSGADCRYCHLCTEEVFQARAEQRRRARAQRYHRPVAEPRPTGQMHNNVCPWHFYYSITSQEDPLRPHQQQWR